MLPPHPFVGDPRHHHTYNPQPDWLTRDLGERINDVVPVRSGWRLRIPVWPGFRLELLLHKTGGQNV